MTCAERRRGRGHGVGQRAGLTFQGVPGRKPRRSAGRDARARARTLRGGHVGGAGGAGASARESGEVKLDAARGVRAVREVRLGGPAPRREPKCATENSKFFLSPCGRRPRVSRQRVRAADYLSRAFILAARQYRARVARFYALLQDDGHRHRRRARRRLALRRPRRGRRRALLLGRRAHGAQGASRSPSLFSTARRVDRVRPSPRQPPRSGPRPRLPLRLPSFTGHRARFATLG